jgi:electron transport complex protein RnfG
MKNTPLSMIAVLACVCIVVSAILGFVNFLTADKIKAIAEEKVQNAMLELIPESTFEKVDLNASSTLDAMYEAKGADGTLNGVCVQTTFKGSVSDITIIVGVKPDNTISGVKITAISETAGLGSKANTPEWLNQFIGLTGKLNLIKNKAEAETDIVAISGATETSTAVTNAVQNALDSAVEYLGGAK